MLTRRGLLRRILGAPAALCAGAAAHGPRAAFAAEAEQMATFRAMRNEFHARYGGTIQPDRWYMPLCGWERLGRPEYLLGIPVEVDAYAPCNAVSLVPRAQHSDGSPVAWQQILGHAPRPYAVALEDVKKDEPGWFQVL